jgi:citryl-CoA lyase
MEWKTAISKVSDEESVIRGYDRDELAQKKTFTDAIFLILKGELPSPAERRLLDAMLVLAIDNSVGAPSALSARIAASGSGSMVQGVAAGLMAFGEFHGGAVEPLAKILMENEMKYKHSAADIVKWHLDNKMRVPGYGHKVFTVDPRTQMLVKMAREEKLKTKFLNMALEIEKELEKQSGKKLPLNVDGCMAALLLDLGFDWRVSNGVFVIARTPGLVAQVDEERSREKPFRRLEPGEVKYDGPAKRKV